MPKYIAHGESPHSAQSRGKVENLFFTTSLKLKMKSTNSNELVSGPYTGLKLTHTSGHMWPALWSLQHSQLQNCNGNNSRCCWHTLPHKIGWRSDSYEGTSPSLSLSLSSYYTSSTSYNGCLPAGPHSYTEHSIHGNEKDSVNIHCLRVNCSTIVHNFELPWSGFKAWTWGYEPF